MSNQERSFWHRFGLNCLRVALAIGGTLALVGVVVFVVDVLPPWMWVLLAVIGVVLICAMALTIEERRRGDDS